MKNDLPFKNVTRILYPSKKLILPNSGIVSAAYINGSVVFLKRTRLFLWFCCSLNGESLETTLTISSGLVPQTFSSVLSLFYIKYWLYPVRIALIQGSHLKLPTLDIVIKRPRLMILYLCNPNFNCFLSHFCIESRKLHLTSFFSTKNINILTINSTYEVYF